MSVLSSPVQAPTPLSDTVGAPSEKDTEENDDHSEGCSTALLIGELLSTDEDDSGITHRWLATALSVSHSTVSELTGGRTTVSPLACAVFS